VLPQLVNNNDNNNNFYWLKEKKTKDEGWKMGKKHKTKQTNRSNERNKTEQNNVK